ncbi:MAG: hypothetical protein RLZZ524_3256 [Pseudomonadota bacterium]
MRVRHRQTGAALVVAMLVVALFTTLATANFWRQWRDLEIEALARQQAQDDAWLVAVQDWAFRLIVDDVRNAPAVDHLGEAWAAGNVTVGIPLDLPVEAESGTAGAQMQVSAQVIDAQSRLNLLALLMPPDDTSGDTIAAWTRLFQRLRLPDADLQTLLRLGARRAQAPARRPSGDAASDLPLFPRRIDQLAWMGLSPASVAALTPHITLLPVTTPVNLNTASAAVLEAVIPGLGAAHAQRLVNARATRPWSSLDEARQALGPAGPTLHPARHGVASKFFLVQIRLQRGPLVRQSEALVERSTHGLQMLWRRTSSTLAPEVAKRDGAQRAHADSSAWHAASTTHGSRRQTTRTRGKGSLQKAGWLRDRRGGAC